MADEHPRPDPDLIEKRSEEREPVEEAGGGEAEGFEQAEEELVDTAEGESGSGHPLGDRFTPEEPEASEHAEYGEADDVRPASRDD